MRVLITVVLGPVILTSLAVNVAVNLWSQSWPMEMRFWLPKAGNMLERRVPMGNLGKGRRAVCDAQIDAPFGSPTRMPFDVEDFLFIVLRGLENIWCSLNRLWQEYWKLRSGVLLYLQLFPYI